jgi:uncharacterized damage-inducible protein DinB
MTYYGARELESSFRTVRGNTVTIAEEIPDDQYGFRPTSDVRSVGETLAHIACATQWQQDFHSRGHLEFPLNMYLEYMQQTAVAEKALKTKMQILSALKDEGDRFATFLGSLGDEILGQRVFFPPPMNASKARFEMLLGVKEHEMHHRAQLMIVERLIGIVPHVTRQRQAITAATKG